MIVKKAKKDLNYWKKTLISILKGESVEKSLHEILFPGYMVKALPINSCHLLVKARGYAVGTIREWKGKKYKKLNSGKWMRAYDKVHLKDKKENRGFSRAIANLTKKIDAVKDVKELRTIVNENISRFQNEDGFVYKKVEEFLKHANEKFPLDKKSAEIAEGDYKGRKLLVGGQYYKKLGSDRFTEDTDYIISEPNSEEQFIHDTENGIDYVNAAKIPIYKEIWEKEKNNDELSLDSAFTLAAYTWKNHLMNFNFDKADDKEHDMKFLMGKMGDKTPNTAIIKKYLSSNEYGELVKFMKGNMSKSRVMIRK